MHTFASSGGVACLCLVRPVKSLALRLVAAMVAMSPVLSLAMTTDEFAEQLQSVMVMDSFQEYQPRVMFPARHQFDELRDAPPQLTEAKILDWASKQAQGGEEFLVAYKLDTNHFKIIRSISGQQTDAKVYAMRYSANAYQDGRENARKDVGENKLVIETFGLPPPSDDYYATLLAERYHIQVRRVAGCVADDKIVGHVKGYNEVSKAEIERRFGSDILKETQAEAQRYWKENHTK